MVWAEGLFLCKLSGADFDKTADKWTLDADMGLPTSNFF